MIRTETGINGKASTCNWRYWCGSTRICDCDGKKVP